MREHLNAFTKLEFDKIKKHIQRFALSDLGRERVEHLLPLSSLPEIRSSLSIVSELKRLLNEEEVPPLEILLDVRSSVHRASIENYVLTSEELRAIGHTLESGRKIHGYFSKRREGYPLLYDLCRNIFINKVIEYNINQAISTDGLVKDTASKELALVRRQIEDRRLSLRKSLEHILKSLAEKEWTQEDIITTREGRMVIPIKTEHKNRISGFIHSTSASGATVFIEPTATLDLNNEICTLQFQEQREVLSILSGLTQQIREHASSILSNLTILAELDFVHAKAKYSIELMANEPQLVDSGNFNFVGARHPLLLQTHKFDRVVPLTLELGDAFNTLLITGPNAGGKSVAMKAVGLLTLLAQSGCHIPASPDSRVRIFSDLYVEMGDEQSIESDLSSFSSHLTNLKHIVDTANDSSLVLIDEIASGTDPVEGTSIAVAVLERLSTLNCATIVTTHQSSLKTFAFQTNRFQNGAMEFDLATLHPTYKFRPGIPGSSYAIEMAERLHLPEIIIERARSLRGKDTNKLELLIFDLEQKAQELNKSLEGVMSERQRYSTLNQFYVNKITELEQEIKAIKSRAVEEGQDLIRRSKLLIEQTIKELRETVAEKEAVKRAHGHLRAIEKDVQALEQEIAETETPEYTFQRGDLVALKGSDATGEIVDQSDNDHFVVMVGAFRVTVSRNDLVKTARSPEMRRAPSLSFELDPAQVKSEIDLRGMYADEAISTVSKAFDNALVAGLHRLSLIHGKGTGALRKKITEYLKHNASVKSFRPGEWNEGGIGVTIVEL